MCATDRCVAAVSHRHSDSPWSFRNHRVAVRLMDRRMFKGAESRRVGVYYLACLSMKCYFKVSPVSLTKQPPGLGEVLANALTQYPSPGRQAQPVQKHHSGSDLRPEDPASGRSASYRSGGRCSTTVHPIVLSSYVPTILSSYHTIILSSYHPIILSSYRPIILEFSA
jgi:hypothetical protein